MHTEYGKTYYISSAPMNSSAARQTCESMGKEFSQKLRLLIIDDEDEFNILKSKLVNIDGKPFLVIKNSNVVYFSNFNYKFSLHPNM